ncbi:MAG: aldo/keto reductase [Clostridia bacterium]|nr:aldo/keto reductase [Clostridia bacterium]
MKRQLIGGVVDAPVIIHGCWRTGGLTQKQSDELLMTAVENGIDYIDTADIYGGGNSEKLLGQSVKNCIDREKIKIQTKCAIHDGLYDFSYEYIIKAVDASLKRLDTEYIDTLILHRPDALMEPEEVARAFEKLISEGKVRHFGVSNHSSYQMRLLQKYVPVKLITNQLQFSVTNSSMIDFGMNVNVEHEPATDRDGGILDYCRLNDITIQAWSPLQYGIFEGCFIGSEKYPQLNAALQKFADEHSITKAAAAFAWILRHPAKIQPVCGSTNPQHLKEICAAADVEMTRAEWYEIYKSAGNRIL